MIGPVDRTTALSCHSGNSGNTIPANTTEAAIFYRLSGGRVCYDRTAERLYFVESTHFPVARILTLILQGIGISPPVEQLHIDVNGFFNGARRISLRAEHARAILTALRIAGIEILPLNKAIAEK